LRHHFGVHASEFNAMKRDLMMRFPASSGDDLLGMEMDFEIGLGRVEGLHDLQVRRTEDAERLIIATAEVLPGFSMKRIAAEIEDAWTNNLSYRFKAAHSVRRSSDGFKFEAVTQIDPRGFFVTAEVTVVSSRSKAGRVGLD
jgi:hypothetical protein